MFNNPEIRSLDMPASNGMSTARALAKLHSLVAEGKLLKDTTAAQLYSNPTVLNQPDMLISQAVSFGKGFWYTKNPQVFIYMTRKYASKTYSFLCKLLLIITL